MSKIHLKYDSNSGLTNNQLFKYTTNGSGVTSSVIYDDGTNVGIGTTTPTSSRLYVKGVDATSSNYALKVDNSAASPLLYIKNNGDIGFGCDPANAKFEFSGGNILLLSFGARVSSIGIGAYSSWGLLGNEISTLENTTGNPLILQYTETGRVGIGTNTPTAGTRLHVYRSVNDFLYEVKVENPNAGISSAASILISSNTGKMEFGQLSSTHTTYSGYGQLGDTFFRSGTGSRNINFITDPGNLGKFLFFSRLNPTTDAAFPSFSIDGSKSGFNSLPDANSIVYIKGIDATSGNYALKVDNSATSPLLYIRNDGNVGIGTLNPDSILHIKGTTGYNQFRLETSYTPTSSADTNGNIGDIAWDDNYMYVKTNTGWGRSTLDYGF